MGMSHHQSEKEQEAQRRLLNAFVSKAIRASPDKRLWHEDEGESAFAIATDPQNKIVRIQFTKPMVWLGLSAQEARAMAKLLTEKADELEHSPVC